MRAVTAGGQSRHGRAGVALAWVLPALCLVLLFTVYPVAHTLWTSLHQVMILLPGEPFVGLANYRAVLSGPFFVTALLNSLWFTLISAPLIVLLGLGVAHLLLASFRGRFLVRAVVILPWALPGAISAVLWLWIFHPSWGILNLVLYEAGLIERYIPWLTDPALVRFAVVVAHVWTQFPFAAVLLMAALVAIEPEQLRGGADRRRRPLAALPLRHACRRSRRCWWCCWSTSTLVAFTSYDLVYAMTGGGPGTATTLLSFQIWRRASRMYNFGNGAARRLHHRADLAGLHLRDRQGAALGPVRRGLMAGEPPRRPALSRGARALFLFCAGPVILSLLGSVIPDQALFSFPPDWFGARLHPRQLPLHLHGRAAVAATQVGRRQPRHDLGRRPPGAGQHGQQRHRGARRARGQRRARRARGLRLRPHALSRPDHRLHGDRA